ncbi:hypothetical protein BGZ73_005569 [Actinomortierella ambigua]|nr:hypothetical protein BGZ73_005569 [Actinomortierella ambigua]
MEAEVSGDGGTVAAMTAAPASHVQDDGAVANRSWPSGQASPKTNTTGSSRTTTTTQQTSPTSSSSSSNGRNGAGESNGSNDLTASNMIRKRKSLDQGSTTETAATVVATAAAVDSAQTLGGGVPRGQPFVAAFPIQSPEHLQVMRMLQLGCGEKIRGGYEEGGSKRSGSGPTSTSPLATTSMPGPALVPEGRKKSKTLPIMGSVHSQQAQAQEFRGSMSRAYGHELTSGNLSTATTPSSVSGSSAAAAACTPTPTTTALNNIRQLHQQLNQGLGLCHGSPAPVMQGIPLMTTNAGLRLGTQDIGAKPSTAAATIPSSAPTAASASGSVRHAAPPTHAAFHHYPQAGIPPPLMSSRPPSYPPPGYLESETGYFPPPSSRRPGSPMHPHTPPGGRGIGVGGGGALMHGTASSPSGGMMPAGMMARKPNPAEVPPSVLPADFFVLEEAVLARRRASASEVYRRNL